MKKYISALIISLAFLSACSEEISLTPGISFMTLQPETSDETAIFRIMAQPFSSTDTLKIPFTLGGTAEKGVDYDISAEYFTLSKDVLMDSVVVYTKVLGTGRYLSLSLEIPEGFIAGKYQTSDLILQDKYGFLSFEYAEAAVSDTTDVSIVVIDSNSRAKVLSTTTPIGISVNEEKSTAIEGVDFKLIDSDNLSIDAGTYYTSFKIVPLKSSFDDGMDKVVLSLMESDKLHPGTFAEMEITLVSPES